MMDHIVIVIFFLAFLLLEAFTAACLAAFFSLSKAQLVAFRSGNDPSLAIVAYLMRSPEEVLVTLLFFGSIGGVLCQNLISRLLQDYECFWLQVGVPMLLCGIFGEVIPKVFALKHAIFVAKHCIKLFLWLHCFLEKPRKTIVYLARGLTKFFSWFVSTEQLPCLEDQIAAIDPLAGSHISEEEKILFQGYLRLARLMVKDMINPMHDLVCVDSSSLLEFNVASYKAMSSMDQIPVVQGHVSNLLGVLCLKDVLKAHKERMSHLQIMSMIKKPCFVSESQSLDMVLRSLDRNPGKLLFVVNEYGSIKGFISLSLIMRAGWGRPKPLPHRILGVFSLMEERKLVASGFLDLEVFQRITKIPLSSHHGQITLGGWLVAECRQMLFPGCVFQTMDMTIHVLAADSHRVQYLYIDF